MCIFAPAMKKRLLFLLTLTMLVAVTAVAAKKKFTLVIDAGHGGHDTGAIGKITKEKTINLNVALTFGRLVERNCPDVNVIYTRKTDVFIPLHTRADIANRNKADLFISIHTNALPKGRISRGLETYTLGMHRASDNLEVAKRENEVILYEKDYKQRYQGFDPNSSESYIMFEFMQDKNMAQSVELAKFVQRRTCAAAGRQNKGVKQAGFLVLRETSMPSCLIELGFISTPDEERFLHTSSGVSQLGQGIYQAFLDYKRKYDGNVTVPLKAEPREEVNIPTVVPKDDAREASGEASREARKVQPAEEPKVKPMEEPKAQPVEEPKVQPMDEPKVQLVNEPSEQPAEESKRKETDGDKDAKADEKGREESKSAAPVFKLQILASSTKLKAKDAQLKGVTDVDSYQEGGLYKYTVGASENYNEVNRLRKMLADKFPQAFIIAFKDGRKMDVREAISEFKNKKK